MNKPLEREKTREEIWMLNLRFFLIALVFVASGIAPLIGRFASLAAVYWWIYTFHMPLFVFVTGYFAKRRLAGRQGRKDLRMIAAQYAIFQTLYSLADAAYFHTPDLRHSFILPYFMLWFLVSHLGWRLAAMGMEALRVKHPFLLSLALGVLVGFLPWDGEWLSISRTFVFLPFFVLGYRMDLTALRAWYLPRIRRLALAAGSLLLLAVLSAERLSGPISWLYGSATYAQLGVSGSSGPLFRMAVYLLQILAASAFLALVPFRHSRMTRMGGRTLYVFLLHGFLLRAWVRLDLYAAIRTLPEAVLFIAIILLLVAALTHPLVKRWTGWLVEPQFRPLAKRLHVIVESGFHRFQH